MAKSKNPELDLSFYTELRHSGTAEEIIKRFAGSTRALLKRLGDDLREGGTGEFSGGAQQLRAPLAAAAERAARHVDFFESLVASVPEAAGPAVRNVIANVVEDANFSEVAQAHVDTPKAKEGKFDQERGAGIVNLLGEIGDKVVDVGGLVPGIGGLVLKIIGVLLKDAGIVGKLIAKPARNEVGEQLEKKLDFIIPGVEALKAGQGDLKDGQRRISDAVRDVDSEVRRIERKADTLGELLGKTLVGEPWIVDPFRTVTGPNKTPAKGVKEELHDIEDLLNLILNLLRPVITDGPVFPPPPPRIIVRNVEKPTVPPTPVLTDGRLKKIFVYAENTFAAQSRSDRRVVRVQTGAFDLSGWLDLSRLRPGDRVETQIRVSFAGRRNLLFARTRFDTPGLKSFADLANGLNYLSGNSIDIVLRQTASADDFATPVEMAYQFVVESQ